MKSVYFIVHIVSTTNERCSVNLDIGKWKCWICDKAGNNPASLIRKFGTVASLQEWRKYDDRADFSKIADEFDNLFAPEESEEPAEKLNLPKEYVSLANKEVPISSIGAKAYLNKKKSNSE